VGVDVAVAVSSESAKDDMLWMIQSMWDAQLLYAVPLQSYSIGIQISRGRNEKIRLYPPKAVNFSK
jgi:hypothetical protein